MYDLRRNLAKNILQNIWVDGKHKAYTYSFFKIILEIECVSGRPCNSNQEEIRDPIGRTLSIGE